MDLLLFDAPGRRRAERGPPAGPRDEPDGRLLARVRARHRGRPGLRVPGPRAVGPGRGGAVRRAARPARPVRARRRRSAGIRPGPVAIGSGCDRSFDEERGRRPVGVRLGGRPPAQSAAPRHGRLRGARARLHRAPELGRDRRPAWHLRRVHRADPVPGRPWCQRDRTAAGVRVRSARRARGTAELLGLPAGFLLRPARSIQQPARPARRCRRVPRSRQGAPPGRARGHPRRRLQPHRRERPRRADVLLPRARQRGVLPARRPRRLRRLQRDRQQPRRQRRGGAQAHRRQPALLGLGDARRRVPLRSRVRAVTRRGRPAAGATADPVGHRQRPGAVRDEADRRGMGRRRVVPGRLVRWRPLGGVERPLPG